MGEFNDMANGISRPEGATPAHHHDEHNVFSSSKRRSLGTVFLKNRRRVAFQQVTGIPSADPENIGAIYKDTDNFLKVSIG